MIPHRARRVLYAVAREFGIVLNDLLGKSRRPKLVLARIEAAKRLTSLGSYYTTKRVGAILEKDHTTIVFYLGRGQKQPSGWLLQHVRRWKKPVVRHLDCEGCYRCYFPEKPPTLPRPVKPIIYYLQPYAGADPREYKWKERRVS